MVLLSVTVTFLAACNGFVGEAAIEPAPQLVATWSLATVDGKAPAHLNIRSWQLSIHSDGRWSYSGEMQGRWAGMQLYGDGNWKALSPEQIEYTAGDQKGTLTYRVTRDTLTLLPDPVIAKPAGGENVATTYDRVQPRTP